MVGTRSAATVCLSAAAAILSVGCQGRTIDAKQTQDVSPDGRKATQTQTRVRETESGAVVKETATRTREVMKPTTGRANTPVDAREPDPLAP